MSQQINQGKKVNVVNIIVLFLALIAMAFFGVCSPQGYQNGLSGHAGSVKSEEITQQEFVRAYQRQSDQMRQRYRDDFDPAALRLAGSVLDQLIKERVLYLKAKELGFLATDDEVVAYLSNLDAFADEKGVFSEEYFVQFLRGNRYTEASFQEELRRSITLQRLQQMITSTAFVSNQAVELDYKISETKIEVEYVKLTPDTLTLEFGKDEIEKFLAKEGSKEKVKNWYEARKGAYSSEEKVQARHILISFKGARNAGVEANKRTKADALEKAKEILKQTKAPNADFATIAKNNTDEQTGKEKGGNLGYFGKNDMVKEFSEVAFVMEKGEISDVVESPFGYHIIKVEGKKEATNISLADATPSIVERLLKFERTPELLKAKAEELLKLVISKPEAKEYMAKNNLSWEKTGSIALNASYIPGMGTHREIKDAILQLSEDKKIHDKVVHVGDNYFILKLASLKKADTSKLDQEKKKIGRAHV